MAKSVEILVYDGMNELDFSAVYEILSAVEVMTATSRVAQKGFQIDAVADRISPIETSHGLKLFPQKGLAQSVGANILIVPGGPGARRPHVHQSIIDWLTRSIGSADLIAAISTGTYILGRAGLINDRKVATHYTMIDDLHRQFMRANIISASRVVADGRNMMTSSGGSAAIDLALAIVWRFYGEAAMKIAANRIEFPHLKAEDQ